MSAFHSAFGRQSQADLCGFKVRLVYVVSSGSARAIYWEPASNTEQQNRTEPNRTEQSGTERNRTKQNKTNIIYSKSLDQRLAGFLSAAPQRPVSPALSLTNIFTSTLWQARERDVKMGVWPPACRTRIEDLQMGSLRLKSHNCRKRIWRANIISHFRSKEELPHRGGRNQPLTLGNETFFFLVMLNMYSSPPPPPAPGVFDSKSKTCFLFRSYSGNIIDNVVETAYPTLQQIYVASFSLTKPHSDAYMGWYCCGHRDLGQSVCTCMAKHFG